MADGSADLHATDEPDGTPALAASLRPAGESLTSSTGADGDPGDDLAGEALADDTEEGTPPFSRPVLPGESRAGYDVTDASGSTDAVRPQ